MRQSTLFGRVAASSPTNVAVRSSLDFLRPFGAETSLSSWRKIQTDFILNHTVKHCLFVIIMDTNHGPVLVNDMKSEDPSPQKEPFSFLVQNDAQCSETNEKSIFRFVRFLFSYI